MIALDLFAGTGWGVACQRLGIEEHGVEIMPEARATRAANGMTTVYGDVWDGLEDEDHIHMMSEITAELDLLIASPPCQTFSMAGGGAGRKALDEVLGLIRDRAYLDVEKLRAFGEAHDPRTALVLTPLAHVARDAPLYVVFEQVPPVLPVWEACAEEMRRWGYSVWTGIVNAEQYGVPQTRRRAILIARADGGEAKMPTPTHSRYHSSGAKKGTFDEGVLPWVSMAEALDWGVTEKEGGRWVYAGAGRTAEQTAGQRPRELDEPAHTMTGKGTAAFKEVVGFARCADSSEAVEIDGEKYRARDLRSTELPAQHLTEKARSWTRRGSEGAERVTVAEAAALQSYPPDFEWNVTLPNGKPVTKTKQFLQIGNAVPPLLAEAILRCAIS